MRKLAKIYLALLVLFISGVVIYAHFPQIWGAFFGLADFRPLLFLVRLVRRIQNGLNGQPLHRFLEEKQFDYIISLIAVGAFTLLTAYDSQKIKQMGNMLLGQGEVATKAALLGAYDECIETMLKKSRQLLREYLGDIKHSGLTGFLNHPDNIALINKWSEVYAMCDGMLSPRIISSS